MRIGKPPGILAGFHVEGSDEVPELQHAGEYWAPAHWNIGDHAHGVWELLLQLSGEAVWESGGRDYKLAPGDLFAVAPGVGHLLRRRARSRHHFLYAAINLDGVWARQPELRLHWTQALVHRRGSESLTAPFRALIREASRERPHRAAALRCTLDLLLIEATRLLEERSESQGAGVMHPAVVTAREHLDGAPERDWKLAHLARLTGLSPTHFTEIFARDVGEPPHRYLLGKRMERARELLGTTDLSISDLALELGFSSGQHFAAVFRRHTGTTPRAYRTAQHAGNGKVKAAVQ